MTGLPPCLLFSRDSVLEREVRVYLRGLSTLRTAGGYEEAIGMLEQHGPLLLLLDLYREDALRLLERVRERDDGSAIIALGEEKTDPALHAQSRGIFALLPREPQRELFKLMVRRALETVHLRCENATLQQECQGCPAPPAARETAERRPPAQFLQHFSRAFKHFHDADALLEGILDAVSGTLMVSRIGIFLQDGASRRYQLRCCRKGLPDSDQLTFSGDAPLVQWMQRNAQLVATATLRHLPQPEERIMLERAMRSMGAEVLVPLHGQNRLLGWISFGSRATGIPFDVCDLEDLVVVSEYISRAIENSLLHEEVSIQRRLSQTLLESLPIGVITVDPQGKITTANRSARELLHLDPDVCSGRPLDRLGRPVSAMVYRAMNGETQETPTEWQDQRTKRSLAAEILTFQNDGPLGILVLIHDQTHRKLLDMQQERIDRANFWTDLAAAMSHEIRNPLVVIKTFAQLLPERYEDEQFRQEFSRMVSREVDRLNGIVDQVHTFANPPEMHPEQIDPELLVRDTLNRYSEKDKAAIRTRLAAMLPPLHGDREALEQALGHLIDNALTACNGRDPARIEIVAETVGERGQDRRLSIKVRDNGPGIDPELREKLFSPFCTTKARGMGLGLPIVNRIVTDHNGEVEVQTGEDGTEVAVFLPLPANREPVA